MPRQNEVVADATQKSSGPARGLTHACFSNASSEARVALPTWNCGRSGGAPAPGLRRAPIPGAAGRRRGSGSGRPRARPASLRTPLLPSPGVRPHSSSGKQTAPGPGFSGARLGLKRGCEVGSRLASWKVKSLSPYSRAELYCILYV